MRSASIRTLVMAALCHPGLLPAQAPLAPASQIHIDSITADDLSSDRLRLVVRLTLTPFRSATVTSFSFTSMKVNDMPFYVAPLNVQLQMEKNKPVPMPDLHVTIYLRDLNSAEPIRKLLRDERAVVAGDIVAETKLNPLEQLVTHSMHPRIIVPFHQEIPVSVPGGHAGAAAALAALSLAQQFSPAASQVLGNLSVGEDTDWRRDVEREQIQHLVRVRTSYTVSSGVGRSTFTMDQIGFWVGRSNVLVPAEALQPWVFDADTRAVIEREHGAVDPGSVDITVTPLSARAAEKPWQLSHHDFTITSQGKPQKERVIYSAEVTSLRALTRESADNYAVLTFSNTVSGSPVTLSLPASTPQRWAVVRLVRATDSDDVTTEVVMLPGHIVDKRIVFDEPIDDSAFGSPVFSREGSVAMVQSETSAVMLNALPLPHAN